MRSSRSAAGLPWCERWPNHWHIARGQISGVVIEMFVRDSLAGVAKKHGLCLDFKRPRKARGGQGRVTWQDGYGHKHNLGYVPERGGTEEAPGVPVAFIESAWRR